MGRAGAGGDALIIIIGPDAREAEFIILTEGNLCRCSAYKRIVEAIESVAREQGGRR